MIRITGNLFYDIGAALHPLGIIKAGDTLMPRGLNMLLNAQQQLEYLLKHPVLPLQICTEDGWALHKTIAKVLKRVEEQLTVESDKEFKNEFDNSEAYLLGEGVKKFEAVFAAELSHLETYFVSSKGIFSTTTLIESGDHMFPESIRSKLPKEAIEDIKQGTKCFAFELPTAAAFHFLRAIEAVIHSHYDILSGNAARPKRSAMGLYIDELIKFNAQPEIVEALKQIKDLHRNPVAHPEEVLDMADAQMLMGIMQSAISAMAKVL